MLSIHLLLIPLLYFQGDGTNEHGKNGRPLFQEEIAIPQMVEKVVEGGVEVFKTMSLSEKHRYVVTLGRVKETSTELRKLHGMMQEYYDPVMAPESEFVFSLTGDMKYLSSMNGHSGASSTYPCNCCVRSRKGMVSSFI